MRHVTAVPRDVPPETDTCFDEVGLGETKFQPTVPADCPQRLSVETDPNSARNPPYISSEAKKTLPPGFTRRFNDDAAVLLDKAIAGCRANQVAEIRSLGNNLASWRTEIQARHTTGASNGPTEGLNLCVKKVKRCGHGFRRFDNYRLRVLLHTGGVTWPERP
jgi:hypothetical protein